MDQIIRPVKTLSGSLRVPSDKSIAHRAAIIAAISNGTSRIENYPRGADTLSTVRCLGQLGVESWWDGSTLVVAGKGLYGLHAPDDPIDCGNSGSTMRLLTGLLAAQSFDSILVGDESLMRRPMARVADPLGEMGARISLNDGRAPITINGCGHLSPIEHTLRVPSAQVKSAISLAALTAGGETIIHEPQPSRDHTERMLRLETTLRDGIRTIVIAPRDEIEALDISIPGDFSSAAFYIVAALRYDKDVKKVESQKS